jgi:predicted amidophosphoribosyltransferase
MGIGAGVGMMMPAMMAQAFRPEQTDLKRESVSTVTCPKCHSDTPEQSRFCYRCGHQMFVQNACPNCNQQLPTEASFCMHCGFKLDTRLHCPHCNAELMPGSKFCGECGKPTSDNKPGNSGDNA